MDPFVFFRIFFFPYFPLFHFPTSSLPSFSLSLSSFRFVHRSPSVSFLPIILLIDESFFLRPSSLPLLQIFQQRERILQKQPARALADAIGKIQPNAAVCRLAHQKVGFWRGRLQAKTPDGEGKRKYGWMQFLKQNKKDYDKKLELVIIYNLAAAFQK